MPSLQIRDVPEGVHRRLKARAAMAGRSLSEHALFELRRSLERPTLEEYVERVRELGDTDVPEPGADAVAAERAARGGEAGERLTG